MMIPSPRADGWHFLKVRRRHAPLSTVPVIVMTGLVSASDEWTASLGACRLLRKPVELDTLVECVRRCLGECQDGARG
jgi:DNA-binding response OmpR family regulator